MHSYNKLQILQVYTKTQCFERDQGGNEMQQGGCYDTFQCGH